MTVFAPALGAIWKQLEGYGIDPEPLFREEGVDPEAMFDQGARVSMEKYQRLDMRAAELSGDPSFGLRSADYARPAHLGALGFAWLASSSLRTAFQRLCRYARVIQDKLDISLTEDKEYFSVSIEAHMPLLDEHLRENGQLAVLVKFCRIIAGRNFNPAKLKLKQAEPDEPGDYYEMFRCPIEFNSDHTVIVIHLEDIDKRLTGSNDELARLNEHIVVKYLAYRGKKDIVNRVKAEIIDELGSGGVNETSVASALHTTPRNLHRKLQAKNTSFKTLLTEIRQDLAKQYIQDRTKTLTEISFLLGFSEVSSFSRAYKGWTGKPPSEERQASSV